MINYPKTGMQVFIIFCLNFLLLLFGYIIGSLNTSIIMSQKYKKDDVRKHYSQNAGATNSLRTYGKKFALIVFAIDFAKVILPTLLFSILINHWQLFNDFAKVYWMSPQTIGLGVVIGHCWPIFFDFKGGKGVTCASAFILTINPILWLIAFAIFFITFFVSRKVSLSSLITASSSVPLAWIPWFTQGSVGYWLNFVNYSDNISPSSLQPYWFVSSLYLLIIVIIIIVLHKSNIQRLLTGKEPKLSLNTQKVN